MKKTDFSSKYMVDGMRGSLLRKKCEMLLRRCFSSWMGRTILALGSLLLLFFIYHRTSRVALNNGDDSSILLQTYDLIHTSHILKGWYLPSDNFVTLDVPLYAMGLLAGFKMTALMKIVPAFLYAAMVLTGIYLASLTGIGKQRLFAVAAFIAIVAFPSYDLVLQALHGPIHMGTILGTMLALIAYHAYKEYAHKLVSLLSLALLTSLLVIGDPMSEVILIMPLLLVEALLLYKHKFASRSQYFAIATVLFATVFAFYVRHLWGQYVQTPVPADNLMFNDIPAMAKNGVDAIQIIFGLFRGDFFGRNIFTLKTIPIILDAVVVILLLIGIGKWCKEKVFSLSTSRDMLTAVLVFIIIGDICAYVFTNVTNIVEIRYLIPVLIFGGIVACSVLSYIKKPELYIGILLIFLLNSSLFVNMVYHTPAVVQPEKPVISFLKEKHLTKGIGEYWSATGVTGQSNYSISVRQVLPYNNQFHPYFWFANGNWFSYNSIKDSQFVIYRKGDGGYYEAAVGSFGKPDHVYTVNEYIILAWNTPLFSHTTRGFHFITTP